jgi:hypothetical protein
MNRIKRLLGRGRMKVLAPFIVAIVMVGSLIVGTEVASAAWVQNSWNLTTWGSVQTQRDSANLNHWRWIWYAPGDGVPSFVVNELWLGAPCNGGVGWNANNGNGWGSGAAFRVIVSQQPGSQYSCVAPQDGRWSGGAPLTQTNNGCASWYSEGWMGSYAPTSIVKSNGIFCSDGTPAYITIDIGGYNG